MKAEGGWHDDDLREVVKLSTMVAPTLWVRDWQNESVFDNLNLALPLLVLRIEIKQSDLHPTSEPGLKSTAISKPSLDKAVRFLQEVSKTI